MISIYTVLFTVAMSAVAFFLGYLAGFREGFIKCLQLVVAENASITAAVKEIRKHWKEEEA